MRNERVILCGGAPSTRPKIKDLRPLELSMWGQNSNITLNFEDIRKPLWKDIPSQFLDLIEIATYVYTADQAIKRGGAGAQEFGAKWRRKLFFRIPVRHPDLWSSDAIMGPLIDVLSFLSEDEYYFDFIKHKTGPVFQQYLSFSDDVSHFEKPEEVVMFSGGLDSLGGAIQEVILDKRNVALVNHRPTPKTAKRHNQLLNLLKEQSAIAPLMHIPVRVNKDKALYKECTQRSRSFLYASMGATIAQLLDLSRLRFYENGIISLNLPLSAQVVGARATRTTHPKVLKGFSKLFTALAGKAFIVENPFLWKTKTEILELISNAGGAEMIRYATSCTHTWEMTRLNTHCGKCSQCIDRRFAVLAAGMSEKDPAEAYGVDLLVDDRKEGESRTMLASYVETASEISGMLPVQFFERFGEASRVLCHIDGSPDTTAMRVFELHQRHAKQVTKVVDDAIRENATAIRKRELPKSCLLRLVCDSVYAGDGSHESQTEKRSVPGVVEPDNYIRRRGEYWKIRFAGGEEIIYSPDIGFTYIQILLTNPGVLYSAAELLCLVIKEPEKYAPGDAGEVLDAEAISAYRTRQEELKEELDEAEKNNDLALKQNILEDLEWLDHELKSARGLGGIIRRAKDDRNRTRNRVCNAIKRAHNKICQYDSSLGKHLEPPTLVKGNSLIYRPVNDIEWTT